MAWHMGWLAQDSSLLGTLARSIYGPDVRQEMKRLQLVKETTPEIPRITALCYHEVRPDRKELVKPHVCGIILKTMLLK